MTILVKLLSYLPLKVLHAIAILLYVCIYYGVRYRRKLVIANLQRVFPDYSTADIETLAKSFYWNYSQVLVEIIKATSIDVELLKRRVSIENPEVITDYLTRGQSVLVAMGHQCNVEWLALATGLQLGYPLDAVYKPIHNKALDDLILASRSRFDGKLISSKDTLAEILRRRDIVRCIAIAPDQLPRRRHQKYWSRFLNQDTAFYFGLETIARVTECPVVFMAMKRTAPGRYTALVTPIAEPPYQRGENGMITEKYVRLLEAQVLEHPADWLWSHRRWRYDKPLYDE